MPGGPAIWGAHPQRPPKPPPPPPPPLRKTVSTAKLAEDAVLPLSGDATY